MAFILKERLLKAFGFQKILRAIKFQIDALTELLEQQGITCYGSTNKQVKLKDYQLDDKDNFIVKTSERSY